MRELRRQQHPAVAARLHWALPVQRVRTLPQDQRREPAAREAEQTAGECLPLPPLVTRSLSGQVLTRTSSRASIRRAPCRDG